MVQQIKKKMEQSEKPKETERKVMETERLLKKKAERQVDNINLLQG